VTFLDPLAGIIAASITLPALTLLYFLKLRRRPVRVSSTLLWTRSVHDLQVNAPFQWIRPSWLLLLQLLAAALLSAALARPAIDVDAPPADRLVIVIDRSASMDAPADPDEPERTRLDEAKERAREVIDRMSQGVALGGGEAQAMVIDFAAAPRVRQGFTSDRGRLRAAIDAVRQTDQPGDLGAALRLLEAQMLQTAGDDGPAPRIILLTDGGFDRRGAGGGASLGDADVTLVSVGPPPEAPRDNVGVVALSARRDYERPELIRLFARLQSVAETPVDVPVTLTLDGEGVGGRTLRIPAATRDAAGAPSPGEAAVTFEVESSEGGVIRLSARRPDDLPADDAAALLVGSARAVRILMVESEDLSGAQRFANAELADALSIVADRDVERIDAGAYETLARSAAALARYDLVVFSGVRPDAPPPAPTLSFGAIVPTPGLLVDRSDDAAPRSARFVAWRRTHPLLRNVGLDAVRAVDPLALRFPGDRDGSDAAAPNGVSFESLAWGEEGPLIVEIERGPLRRVIVAFPLERSNWPLEGGSFIIFLTHAVERLGLGGAEADARAFTTAESITLRAAADAERVRIEGPVSFETTAIGPDGVATIGRLPLVGLYRAENVVPRDQTLGVNLFDPTESAIATRNELIIGGVSKQAAGVGGAAPLEIWAWFVLAALLVATLEWLLFAWRMRV